MFQILEDLTTYCNDAGVVNIFYTTKIFFLIFQITVPALLIISAIISLISLMNNPDEPKIKKKMINKFIAALVIFVIPYLVSFVLSMIDTSTKKDTFDIVSCWNSAADIYKANAEQAAVEEKAKSTIYKSCIPLSSYKNDQGTYDYPTTCEMNPEDEKWYECLDKSHNCFEGGVKGTGMSQSVKDKINKAIADLKSKLGDAIANRYPSGNYSSDQASKYATIGFNAYNEGGSDCTYRRQIIDLLVQKVQSVQAADNINMSTKYLTAKAILESGWLHPTSLVTKNNIYGMNDYKALYAENAKWSQYKTSEVFRVIQNDGYHNEKMKTYKSMEDSIEDFALIMLKNHPELNGMNFQSTADLIENRTQYTADPDSYSDILSVGNTIEKCFGHVD